MSENAARPLPDNPDAFAAAFVLGLESRQGSLTINDYQVAVQRLERAIRPWDSVLDVAPRSVGVLCAALTNAREIEAIAERLVDVVRAPMSVGDEIRTLGVCVGSSRIEAGEEPAAAFRRARSAMQQMRQARAGLLAPEVPEPRDTKAAVSS